MKRRIYLAASWRTPDHPRILTLLRGAGHEVYDFREHGFHWDQIDPWWERWSPAEYKAAMTHPVAVEGFHRDFEAMIWANTCVLLLPSGPSAAIEAGWCKGSGRFLVVHVGGLRQADLMYKMADHLTLTDQELLSALELG